jgi:hypothetical protein
VKRSPEQRAYTRAQQTLAFQVGCPKCGALPRESCLRIRLDYPMRIGSFHPERVERALRQHEESQA